MTWTFGPQFPGHPKQVEMKELRRMDAFARARAFKARADAFFIKQVDTFQTPRPWAPFPLAVMTCIGIEMVGSYKYGDAQGDRNDHFKKLVEDIDQGFAATQLSPESKSQKLSYFVYKGFRNSLAHGLYGKWVFITHKPQSAKTFRYSPQKHFVVINVYWFYRRFKEVYEDYFRTLLAATNTQIDPLATFNRTFEGNFSLWI
jgi:hypothetical protein